MSCSHEHSHGDGDGGHGGERVHDHSHDVPLSAGPADSLYGQIDIVHVEALNAEGGGESGQHVFKSWDERDDETSWVESDADDSMIIRIPFNASVSLRSITVKSGPLGKTPSEIQLFRDAPGMDFLDAEANTATQVFRAVESTECVEYQVKAAKFSGLTSLTLFFPGNNSGGQEDTTRIYYIGLRGKWSPLPGRPGTIIYEAVARPQDHKTEKMTEGQSWGEGY